MTAPNKIIAHLAQFFSSENCHHRVSGYFAAAVCFGLRFAWLDVANQVELICRYKRYDDGPHTSKGFVTAHRRWSDRSFGDSEVFPLSPPN